MLDKAPVDLFFLSGIFSGGRW